ncbi:hypothetical protein K505DRAFT_372036 [Melanomma pulvis-pyrius CBS 109.77]|uniref:F-box domain-containing protein n=1 Tax=Melanomma pulvis-pyrius CBS 109.77 TaxID=1314802 RepID=A0A6A6XPB9_9PLEO|nr:hypothetical protein K505DRAFT_372036 [Melanomma pulvis-pyrius CBS 109.77]
MSLPTATSTATPSTTAPATLCPISVLPHELLTKVISHIPLDIGDARFVCRGFRDCAWSALGARIQNTIFDIRSVKSMENFRNIAKSKDIALHITYLNLTTGFIAENFPHEQFTKDNVQILPEDYMTDDLISRTLEYRTNKRCWFADAWSWTPCMPYRGSENTAEEYATFIQIPLVTDFLATVLSKFNNLRRVTYKENSVPADFQDVYRDVIKAAQGKGAQWRDLSSKNGSALNILGLDIVLRALVKANVAVKELDIPIPMMYTDLIFTFTPPPVLQKVLANVQFLRIELAPKDDFIHHLKFLPGFMLTSDSAPKLKSLRYRGSLDGALVTQDGVLVTQLLMECPPIQDLHLYECEVPLISTFFSYMSKISRTLRTLTVYFITGSDWVHLINFLAASPDISLEKLVLIHNDFKGSFFKELPVQIREAVFGAAPTVIFYPPSDTFMDN